MRPYQLEHLRQPSCSYYQKHVPIKNAEKITEKTIERSVERTTDKIVLKDLSFKTVMIALHQQINVINY